MVTIQRDNYLRALDKRVAWLAENPLSAGIAPIFGDRN